MTHYGEMSIMWDLYMETHTGDWDKKKFDQVDKQIHEESDHIRGVKSTKKEFLNIKNIIRKYKINLKLNLF